MASLGEFLAALQRATGALLDATLVPLDWTSPFLSLALAALATAALTLLSYRLLSRPERIERARRRAFGALLAPLVFGHDLGEVGRSLLRFGRSTPR